MKKIFGGIAALFIGAETALAQSNPPMGAPERGNTIPLYGITVEDARGEFVGYLLTQMFSNEKVLQLG